MPYDDPNRGAVRPKATSLVTGGAGFIGSHVIAELLARGHRVVSFDDLSGGIPENVPAGATQVTGSILDHVLLRELFARHQFDYVFHLAAYAAEGLSHFIKRFNYENNLVGSANLINAAVNHHVKCFVFTSSIAVYGDGQVPMTETLVPQPEDPYGIAKYAVELELRASRRLFDLNHVIFRPHNVYGERQNLGDRYRNVIGIFMNQLLQGKPLPIFGDGEQTRAFSYIGDVAPIIADAVTTPRAQNEIFNVGADHPCTVNALARAVCHAFGAEFDPVYLPARHEVKHAYPSHEKARAVFNSEPRYSLADGLARMAPWAKRAGVRSSRSFGELEIARNLPASWCDPTG